MADRSTPPTLLSDWQLHTAQRSQDAQLRTLFAQVFGHTMGQQEWDWKYRGTDLRGSLLTKASTGDAIAFFGGMPRTFSHQGRTIQTVQNGDVMVRMQERGVFSRKGALFQVAQHFFSQHLGAGAPYAFAFGFPNTRHFQLGLKLGLYRQAGCLQQLRWAPQPAPWQRLWAVQTLAADAPLTALDALWPQMQASWPQHFLPLRSASHWAWRYQQRPGVDYHLLLVRQRLTGKPLAALALRLHPEHCDWLDYLGPRQHLPHAIAAARAFAHQHQRPVQALVSDAVASDFCAAQPQGLHSSPSDISIPTNAIDAAGPTASVAPWQGHLWLMGGDSDFM